MKRVRIVSVLILSGVLTAIPGVAEATTGAPAIGIQHATPLGSCGDSNSAVLLGSHAHWTIECDAGKIGVYGTVTDDAADGRCAAVKVKWADGSTSTSEAACPEGVTKSFGLHGFGAIADVYLFEYVA